MLEDICWQDERATLRRMNFPNLETSDSDERDDAEEEGVERPGGEVDDLLLGRSLGEAEPEGEDGQGDAAETGQHEEDVVDAVEGSRDLKFFGVRQKPFEKKLLFFIQSCILLKESFRLFF